MAQQTLQEMDNKAFLAKTDVLWEALERQVERNPLGDWTVQSVKEEVRRRLLGRQVVVTEAIPITVEVEKLNLSDMTLAHPHAAHFHGTPYRLTVTSGDTAVSHGFFSETETDAFLLGLETARRFGFSFAYLSNIPSP
ncbi:MAG TPA: hypothetical protein DEF00_04805 [Candidatus Taylorbacteria bacterium]|nr:MAG: hypothetical protein UY03_C0007G0063 [Parcubacteria group bacterium GW2011_GWA2_47_64]KKU95458.1 MAG: hypothetical protein UY29_C0026G0003 [Parcubacteria group bacterium GW2011_GWC2_48_17]HBV01669.1 hypothetical protein [Candidatus Taylorbacteria bacterium]